MTRSVLARAGTWILAAIAGAQGAEQSTFMDGDVCASRHVRLLCKLSENRYQQKG